MSAAGWMKDQWSDPFKRYLIIILLVVGIGMLTADWYASSRYEPTGPEIHFFTSQDCDQCDDAKKFNKQLIKDFGVQVVEHDISDPTENDLLRKLAQEQNVSSEKVGVPALYFGNDSVTGFESKKTTGEEIAEKLSLFLYGEPKEKQLQTTLHIPFFGEINVMDYSLTALSIILGFVDGFNPCAMWVLVYLISILMTVNDRRKIWIIVGSFVFASGVLYFLFMTAWLNVFLFIGFMRPVMITIGLLALGIGILDLKTYFTTKGELVCEVGDMNSKQKTMSKIKKIAASPINLATIGGIIVLAFVINSIEFACSAGIPAIFTQVLALSDLSGWEYYGYILLYDFFFMLDDLLIFGLAAFAVNATVGHKYARYCKLIGGIILLALGIVMVFFPQFLA